jgi:hypothetical protein
MAGALQPDVVDIGNQQDVHGNGQQGEAVRKYTHVDQPDCFNFSWAVFPIQDSGRDDAL